MIVRTFTCKKWKFEWKVEQKLLFQLIPTEFLKMKYLLHSDLSQLYILRKSAKTKQNLFLIIRLNKIFFWCIIIQWSNSLHYCIIPLLVNIKDIPLFSSQASDWDLVVVWRVTREWCLLSQWSRCLVTS